MLIKDDLLKLVQGYYQGFYIKEDVGNNSFSFEDRSVKEIYVAKLLRGGLDNLVVSDRVVFSEVQKGQECNQKGLKNFLYFPWRDKDIFIFDNHNHAFFFWSLGFYSGLIANPTTLIHVDQHTDMRDPLYYLSIKEENLQALAKVFDYTNNVLNVGNFIKPAESLGFFNQVVQINSEESFHKDIKGEFVLDIDMDIFSEEMGYLPSKLKIEKIRNWIDRAQWITIATSPYFMDQKKAIELIKQLLD